MIGRKQELALLEKLYNSPSFQFLIMYGRRRVGKTTILQKFAQSHDCIFFPAQEKNDVLNLEDFSQTVQEHYTGDYLAPFPSWEKALAFIEKQSCTEKRTVLIIDEFPFLAAQNPSIKSIFQHAIDHRWQNRNIFLILCGSSVSFIIKNVNTGGGVSQPDISPFYPTHENMIVPIKRTLIAIGLMLAVTLPAFALSGNPVLPGFHADPEILYSNKTKKYYIYSTTDGQPGWGGWYFTVFSSVDLKNWKDEGIMLDLKSDQVPWADGNAWAPCIEEKLVGGKYKYFFYYSGNPKAGGGKQIGVATSDSPTGPFVDLGHPIVTDSPTGNGQQIDVDVFTDPVSGKSYLYWGNGYMAGAELNEDMVSIKKETITVMTPEGGTLQDYAYREAAYVFYRNGLYYFMWSVDDTGSPNYHVAYGTSTSPLGPIKVAKNPVILIQNPEKEIYGPAHNAVLQVPGTDKWYIVYHRINKNYLKSDPGVHREVCIDRMEFNKDGSIKQVIPTP